MTLQLDAATARRAPLLVLLLPLLAGCTEQITKFREPPTRPNIILVITDDQETGSVAFMPRVTQELVAQGVTFDNFFVTTPLCCPSRATFLTGKYAHNHGVLSNTLAEHGGFEQFYNDGNESRTIAIWLQGAGYRTALIGKYLNQYPGSLSPSYIPPGWTDWRVALYGEKYYNFDLNENGLTVRYGFAPEDYEADVIRHHALDFIAESHRADQPFFLMLTPEAPHQPQVPAPRHIGMFAGAEAPRSPNFNEADVSDKGPPINTAPLLDASHIAAIEQEWDGRLESLQSVDEMIGAIVDSLRSYRILDNTYIVFTSDNGYHLGNHRLMPGKQQPFTEDVLVPLIVRGPGVPAAVHVKQLALNTDIAPTLGAWAHAVVPKAVDGRSLARLASGLGEPVWRKSFLTELAGRFIQLRTTRYSYTRNNNGFIEFYDLVNDPYELVNRYDSLPRSRVAKLNAQTVSLSTCISSSCVALENVAPQ